VKIKST